MDTGRVSFANEGKEKKNRDKIRKRGRRDSSWPSRDTGVKLVAQWSTGSAGREGHLDQGQGHGTE